nr:MAG TPA: hypothetical protein [Caudoviricetes sp.]
MSRLRRSEGKRTESGGKNQNSIEAEENGNGAAGRAVSP